MSEKYIDLGPRIFNTTGLDMPSKKRLASIHCVLRWLDAHPDQVPGRTMKKSDYQELMDGTSLSYGVGFTDGFHMAGGSIAPDPEPTNADQIIDLVCNAPANLSRRGLGIWLDKAGVKAPGADDENTDHDRAWWIENANVNDAEDCEACVDDLCPVHHGMAVGIDFVTKKITALGDDPELFNSIPNPPKAPGGDDDC